MRKSGTLYLIGTASGASATAGLVAALVEDVVEVARRLAAGSPGGRLDPPLGLILDEAANYPLPSLGALMSEGGGTGITTLACLQSLAQARHRWGREQAQGIWDSAIVKIVLGGGGDADDLADIARLVGDRTEREYSKTRQPGGGTSVSASTRERAILDPSAIRSITPGHGLVLLRSARPIMLSLRPWTARRDARTLLRDQAGVEEAIRTAAALRWSDDACFSPAHAMTEGTDSGMPSNQGRREISEVERVAALAKLFDADGTVDLGEVSGTMYWPDLLPSETQREWDLLRAWVEHLMARFTHLDHHVIPRCWFRHNGHVEALAALRDQEMANYSETAPGTSAVEFTGLFATSKPVCREWTGQLACGATHEATTHRIPQLDTVEWGQFVNDDVSRRDALAVATTLAE